MSLPRANFKLISAGHPPSGGADDYRYIMSGTPNLCLWPGLKIRRDYHLRDPPRQVEILYWVEEGETGPVSCSQATLDDGSVVGPVRDRWITRAANQLRQRLSGAPGTPPSATKSGAKFFGLRNEKIVG